MHNDQEHGGVDTVHLPSPTAWPVVLALGIALLCTGLVTNIFIGLLGLLLAVCSNVGWFLEPTWTINPRNGQQSFAASIGLLVGIPQR